MRLTKDFHERLQAEALGKFDTEIRSAIRNASSQISNDQSYYLDKAEIKVLKTLSKALYDHWLPTEDQIKIPKNLLPVSFREWKKLDKHRSWFNRVYDDHIFLKINNVKVPVRKKQNLICLKSVEKLFDPIFKKTHRTRRIKKDSRSR